MDIFKVVFLAVVQGITEFLPISSSGHLVLGKALLNLQSEGVLLEVALHFGTFIAILIVFYRTVVNIIVSVFLGIFKLTGIKKDDLKKEDTVRIKLAGLIIVSSIPAGIIGMSFSDYIENAFSSTLFSSLMLIVTACFLFLSKYAKIKDKHVNLSGAVIIGFAQAFAILPGISRSGSTIVTGMFLGINGSEAARYSFLMALPVIFGAALKTVLDLFNMNIEGIDFVSLLTGVVISAITGYFSLRFLLKVLKKGKFYSFSFYCLAVGILGLLFA